MTERELLRLRKIIRDTAIHRGVDDHDAEDMASTVVLRVIASGRSTESYVAFAIRVVANLIRDRFRSPFESQRDRTFNFEIWEKEESEDVTADQTSILMAKEIERILSELPDNYEQAVRLRAEGLTFKEMAAITGHTEGSMKSNYYRGRDALLRGPLSGML